MRGHVIIREKAVAGYFYPEDSQALTQFIERYADHTSKEHYKAVFVPHAGYIYSGKTAVKTLSKVALTDTVIILGTNHTGFGEQISVWSAGSWDTPLGQVEIDSQLAETIIDTTFAKPDVVAHVREHSIEVIVPILKHLKPDIKIVPICIMGMNTARLASFASDLCKVVGDATIIVSTDFNHYEDKQTTDEKDNLAIDAILSVDAYELYDTVMDKGISMCGIYPSFVALNVAKEKGATKGILVEHTTSAEASGDEDSVVGYAGILVV